MKTLHVFYSIAAVFLVYDVVLSQGCDLVKYGQCSVEYNAAATGDQNCTKLQSANECFKDVSVDGCDEANKQTMEGTIAAVAQVVSRFCNTQPQACDYSLYGQCGLQYNAAANGTQDCAELRSAVECFRSIDTCDYVNQLGAAMAARISINVNIVCVVLSQGCDLVKYGQCSVEYNAAATGDQNCTKLQSANECFKGVSVDGCDDANKQTMEATIAAVAQEVSRVCNTQPQACDYSLYGQCGLQYNAAANGTQDCAELRSAVECFRSIDTCDYVKQLGADMAERISIDVNIVCG